MLWVQIIKGPWLNLQLISLFFMYGVYIFYIFHTEIIGPEMAANTDLLIPLALHLAIDSVGWKPFHFVSECQYDMWLKTFANSTENVQMFHYDDRTTFNVISR